MGSGSFVSDKNIGWKRKVIQIRPEVQSGTATIVTQGSGNVLQHTNGQTYLCRRKLPNDLDPTYPIGFRIRTSTANIVPANTATWSFQVGKIAAGASAAGVAAAALSATGADGVDPPVFNPTLVANARQEVAGQIASGYFTPQEIADRVEMVATISPALVGIANVNVSEIDLDYVPKMCKGEGQDRDIAL
jgi:hypothetical protein